MNYIKIDEKLFIGIKSNEKSTLVVRNTNANKGNKVKISINKKMPHLNSVHNDLLNISNLHKKEYNHLLFEIDQPIHNSVLGLNSLQNILNKKNEICKEIKSELTEEQFCYLNHEVEEPKLELC